MSARVEGWQQGPGYEDRPDSGARSGDAEAGSAARSARRVGRLLSAAWWRVWARIEIRRAAQRRRTLCVTETVAMGEKRFVAIVQVEQQRFLVGGGSAGVSLLARLDTAPEFADLLGPQGDPAAGQAAGHIREAW